MKRIVFMICLLGGWMTCCFAQGIVFCELTLEAACRQADSEGKYVFVDCYTSWCGPCRQMATREFVKPEAGTYFNEKFVCVKYDMERGEGIQLRERFKVTAYPTFLLLKSNGTEIGRLVGGNELLPFIEKVEYLLKPENSLSLKKERFKAGQLNKKEMMEYVDFEKIRSNPKWFQGYSDNTWLVHCITTCCDIMTAGAGILEYFHLSPDVSERTLFRLFGSTSG